jgi:hypothetical protein
VSAFRRDPPAEPKGSRVTRLGEISHIGC